MDRTITIDLGKELGEVVDSLAKSERYKTASEAARDGLRLPQEGVASAKLQQLRKLLEEVDNSPQREGFSAAAKSVKILSLHSAARSCKIPPSKLINIRLNLTIFGSR